VLDLRYGGRWNPPQPRIFTNLVKRVLDRMLPVTASVSPANRSGAGDLLQYLGSAGTHPLAASSASAGPRANC